MDFRPHGGGVSRYFILTTITCLDFSVGNDLLKLRRDMVWDGLGCDSEFHATTDLQAVRDRVFAIIVPHDFRIDATVFEKAKAQPHTRRTQERFYQYAWFYHMKHLAPLIVTPGDRLFIGSAAIGTKAKRSAFHDAVADVVGQVSPTLEFVTTSWKAESDPCLQVADYCCWAIGRKWELGDRRSYDLIARKIRSEFEIWRWGTRLYY
jgi:hypothetical protein